MVPIDETNHCENGSGGRSLTCESYGYEPRPVTNLPAILNTASSCASCVSYTYSKQCAIPGRFDKEKGRADIARPEKEHPPLVRRSNERRGGFVLKGAVGAASFDQAPNRALGPHSPSPIPQAGGVKAVRDALK